MYKEWLVQGFFFAAGTKTHGQKISNSRKFSEKLKEISPKTQKSGNFQKLFCHFHLFATKIFLPFLPKSAQAKAITRNSGFFPQKLKKFQETQGNFPKTQVKLYKNSIYRKVHSPTLPPKRRKKTLHYNSIKGLKTQKIILPRSGWKGNAPRLPRNRGYMPFLGQAINLWDSYRQFPLPFQWHLIA